MGGVVISCLPYQPRGQPTGPGPKGCLENMQNMQDDINLEQYVEGMHKMGIPKDVVWLIEYLFSHVLTNPSNQLVVNDVERVLGRKAKTFVEYAQETAKTGVWTNVKVN